jgi:hypothetical protein
MGQARGNVAEAPTHIHISLISFMVVRRTSWGGNFE